ncbi:MAG: glycosyltransferase [Desulfomonile tiedjei]|nr:glycosyltransferase [Desulfomonile tiedjei]
MRVGIVFHKNPFGPPTGIDLVRLRAVATALTGKGIEVEIVAPVERERELEEGIPVRALSVLRQSGRYDLVKTCYHQSIMLVEDHKGPVVSRIVRVVDHKLPERDDAFRATLLSCQERIRTRASALALNNIENEHRWRGLYGSELPIVLAPTGCPATIPPSRGNPFNRNLPVVLFLGSLAAPRMVHTLNHAARRLRGKAEVHLVGLNKACLYGGDEDCSLDPLVIDHGERSESDVWDYIRHAAMGLAVATGPHGFDNDVSKILNYLRGGLPVLSEEPILNNDLVRQTQYGETFDFGDMDMLVQKALDLLENPPTERREQVMSFMAEEHSWDRRVETYVELFNRILK